MSSILQSLEGRQIRRFASGEVIVRQGETTGHLFFLIEGAVEVLKDDVPVARTAEPGVVFGEMAALLGGAHTATVLAASACAFYLVENPREFLVSSPLVCLHVCELLARRLDALNKY